MSSKSPGFLVCALLCTSPVFACELSLPQLFSDHMVLQGEQPVRLWGRAVPHSEVSAFIAGQTGSVSTDADGEWRIELPAMPHGGPHQLVFTSGGCHIELEDIYIGEVWLVAGQSNMAFRFSHSAPEEQKLALQQLEVTNLRSYTVAKIVSGGKLLDAPDRQWAKSDENDIAERTAVGTYFGLSLDLSADVAIGILDVSQGSSTIESWMSDVAIEQAVEAGYQLPVPHEDIRRFYRNPSATYTRMLASVIPFAVRGVVWYQGESNAGDPKSYKALLPVMVSDWRRRFQNADLPFLVAQLPAYAPPEDQSGKSWAEFRAAQAEAVKAIPGSGLAVLVDTGDANNIHPVEKKLVGERLARIAQGLVYKNGIQYKGPEVDEIYRRGDALTILFRNEGEGLVSSRAGSIGFEVRGGGENWVIAETTIDGRKVKLRHPDGVDVHGVRYAWGNTPDAGLYNSGGLPALPFQIISQ